MRLLARGGQWGRQDSNLQPLDGWSTRLKRITAGLTVRVRCHCATAPKRPVSPGPRACTGSGCRSLSPCPDRTEDRPRVARIRRRRLPDYAPGRVALFCEPDCPKVPERPRHHAGSLLLRSLCASSRRLHATSAAELSPPTASTRCAQSRARPPPRGSHGRSATCRSRSQGSGGGCAQPRLAAPAAPAPLEGSARRSAPVVGRTRSLVTSNEPRLELLARAPAHHREVHVAVADDVAQP